MWDLPRPGLEPVFPALAGRFSTTAPPGKPSKFFFLENFFYQTGIWIRSKYYFWLMYLLSPVQPIGSLFNIFSPFLSVEETELFALWSFPESGFLWLALPPRRCWMCSAEHSGPCKLVAGTRGLVTSRFDFWGQHQEVCNVWLPLSISAPLMLIFQMHSCSRGGKLVTR